MIYAKLLGRSTARNTGTYDKRIDIRRDVLENGFLKPSATIRWRPA